MARSFGVPGHIARSCTGQSTRHRMLSYLKWLWKVRGEGSSSSLTFGYMRLRASSQGTDSLSTSLPSSCPSMVSVVRHCDESHDLLRPRAAGLGVCYHPHVVRVQGKRLQLVHFFLRDDVGNWETTHCVLCLHVALACSHAHVDDATNIN